MESVLCVVKQKKARKRLQKSTVAMNRIAKAVLQLRLNRLDSARVVANIFAVRVIKAKVE
jgi:hypothetical protein